MKSELGKIGMLFKPNSMLDIIFFQNSSYDRESLWQANLPINGLSVSPKIVFVQFILSMSAS